MGARQLPMLCRHRGRMGMPQGVIAWKTDFALRTRSSNTAAHRSPPAHSRGTSPEPRRTSIQEGLPSRAARSSSDNPARATRDELRHRASVALQSLASRRTRHRRQRQSLPIGGHANPRAGQLSDFAADWLAKGMLSNTAPPGPVRPHPWPDRGRALNDQVNGKKPTTCYRFVAEKNRRSASLSKPRDRQRLYGRSSRTAAVERAEINK
jgi:hypothetical protein